MSLLWVTFLANYFFIFADCAIVHKEEISLLAEIFKLKKGPPNVVGHLCWPKEEQIYLFKKLSNVNNVRYKILNHEEIFDAPSFYHLSFITSTSCTFFDSFMQKVFKNEFLRSPHLWIILGSVDQIIQKDLYIPVNSKVFLIEKHMDVLKITSVYKVTERHNFTTSKVAEWSAENGFLYFNDIKIIADRSNLQKGELRVSYVFSDNNSIKHLEDNRFKVRDKLTKINYLLYQHMSDLYNMTHVVLKTKEWGLETHPVTKQFYTGMMFDLFSGKAEIGGSISFTPKERLKYFKFLAATCKESIIKFVFRAPPLAYSANVFVLSFDKYVWYACAVVMALCFVVIRAVVKWEAQERSFAREFEDNKENVPNFFDLVTMQVAAICQMDFFYDPKSISGKIATFTLLITCGYIYTAFSARIVLLLQANDNSLVHVGNLYSAKMDMASEESSYNTFFFKFPNVRTNEHWRKLIYENRMLAKGSKTEPFISAEEGMTLVRNDYFAFNIEITTANYFIENTFTDPQRCSVRFVDTVFKGDVPHITCRRDSTFIKFYLLGFRRFFENGIHQREYQRIFTKERKCHGQKQNFSSVGIVECYFPFTIFLVGLSLSLAFLVLEISLHRYSKYRNFRVQSFGPN